MDFPEFSKELEAHFWGAGTQLMGLQLLQLEFRWGKNLFRSFRLVKSAEIFWQIWASCSFRVSLAHDGSWSNAMSPIRSKNCTSLAIGERHLPIESTIASRSTDVMQKARILELKRRYFEDYCSDNQYAVSIKEDTAYPCLHSPKTTKETSSIRRIQRRPIRRIEDIVCEDSGRYQAWSLLQETPNTPYPIPWIRRIEPTSRPIPKPQKSIFRGEKEQKRSCNTFQSIEDNVHFLILL
ncbi:hypothetical protein Tco_1149309 [Tanacetum coccineum]